jgi:hypothetical protein
MSSGFERYPLLLWVMGVDVAVEKQRCGAYISVCVFMVVSPAAHAQMTSAESTLHVCIRVTGPFLQCNLFSRYTAMLTRVPQNLTTCIVAAFPVHGSSTFPPVDLDCLWPLPGSE